MDRKSLIAEINLSFEEGQDLLEQIKLEIDGVFLTENSFVSNMCWKFASFKNPERRSSHQTRLQAYSQELKRLKDDFDQNKNKNHSILNSLEDESEDELDIQIDQKRRLLDNSSRLEKTGRQIEDGYRIAIGLKAKLQSFKC